MELMHNQKYEIERLKREFEKHKHIDLIRKYQESLDAMKTVVSNSIKIPTIQSSKERKDTLHFFVYNTHNLYLFNVRDKSFKSSTIGDKIPANFMSIETSESRIIITGGGEPG